MFPRGFLLAIDTLFFAQDISISRTRRSKLLIKGSGVTLILVYNRNNAEMNLYKNQIVRKEHVQRVQIGKGYAVNITKNDNPYLLEA